MATGVSSGGNLWLFKHWIIPICSAMVINVQACRSKTHFPVEIQSSRHFPTSLHRGFHDKSLFKAINIPTSISRLVSDHQHSQQTRTVSISIFPTRSFVCRKATPSEQAYGTVSFEKEYQLIMSQTPPSRKLFLWWVLINKQTKNSWNKNLRT